MVMEWRAAKDPLSPPSIRQDLEDHADCLGHEDPAHQEQENLLAQRNSQKSDRTAEGQGTRIAHENLGGMTIEPEKSQSRAREGAGEDGQLSRARNERKEEPPRW